MKKQAFFTSTASLLILAALMGANCYAASELKPEPKEVWQPIGLSGGGAMYNPAISPIDPDLMMVNCDMGGAYLSYDGGYNWKMINHSQLGSYKDCQAGFHPKDINTIFAAAGSSIRVTHDRGKTWQQLVRIGSRLEGQIAIDPEEPSLMLVGAAGGVRRSEDGGHNWKAVSGPNGRVLGFHFDMTSPSSKRACFAATVNGIWRSDDGGLNWVKKIDGLPWTPIQAFAGGSNAKSKTVILYCSIPSKNIDGFKGGIYKSTDRGETWTQTMGVGINKDTKAHDQWAQGNIAQYRDILTTNVEPRTVYTYNSGTGIFPPHHATVYRSTNAGERWSAVFYQDPRFGDKYNVEQNYLTAYLGVAWQGAPHGTAIAPSEPNRIMQTDNEMCYITHNGGKNWFNGQTRPVPGSGKPPKDFLNTGLVVTSTWHYYIDPFEHNRHYIAYTDTGLARSLDGDKTWKCGYVEIPDTKWRNTCYEMAFDPEIPGKIWGAFSGTHDIPNCNVILGRHRPDYPGGVGVSRDFGATWAKSNNGLPQAPCCSVVVDPASPAGKRTLYAAIFGHGVYKSTDDGLNWVKKSNGLGSAKNMRAYRVQVHKDGTVFCLVTGMYYRDKTTFETKGAGLYKSNDGGESWTQINDTLLWGRDFTVDRTDSRIIYIGAADAENEQGGLWRTTDGGLKWTKIARKGRQHFGAYLHPSRAGWIYMTLGDWRAPNDSALWLSRDNGKTWEGFMELPFNRMQRVTFDPDNEDIIYVTTFGGSIFKGPAAPAKLQP